MYQVTKHGSHEEKTRLLPDFRSDIILETEQIFIFSLSLFLDNANIGFIKNFYQDNNDSFDNADSVLTTLHITFYYSIGFQSSIFISLENLLFRQHSIPSFF